MEHIKKCGTYPVPWTDRQSECAEGHLKYKWSTGTKHTTVTNTIVWATKCLSLWRFFTHLKMNNTGRSGYGRSTTLNQFRCNPSWNVLIKTPQQLRGDNTYSFVATLLTLPPTAAYKFTTLYFKLALLQILTTSYGTLRENERKEEIERHFHMEGEKCITC